MCKRHFEVGTQMVSYILVYFCDRISVYLFYIESSSQEEGYACRFHIFAVVTARDYLRLYRIDVIIIGIIASGQTAPKCY